MSKQESCAAARKPRDAEAILFGLMSANQTNLTKQNLLCLKADVNVLRCITTDLITILQRHGHILSVLRHFQYQ